MIWYNSGVALPSPVLSLAETSTKADAKYLPSGLREILTVLISPSKSR
ncbi:MAG: hypothetical protein ACKPCM_03330 [Pseudanabaena sp.]